MPEFTSTLEHAIQSAVPAFSLYESAGQIVHEPPRAVVPDVDSVPEYPVLQRQLLPPFDPAGLTELASQLTQVFEVWAVSALNFPEPQFVHAAADPAVTLNLPATHAATLVPSPA